MEPGLLVPPDDRTSKPPSPPWEGDATTLILPELPAPAPLEITMLPLGKPAPRVLPADSATEPPSPVVDEPAMKDTEPEGPPVASPVVTKNAPEIPLLASPVPTAT